MKPESEHSYAQALTGLEHAERRTQAPGRAVWITHPMTSPADTVSGTRNTCGANTGCSLLSLLARLSTNSLVKQITSICNGRALHHDLFSSSNQKSLQLPHKNAEPFSFGTPELNVNSSGVTTFFTLFALSHHPNR